MFLHRIQSTYGRLIPKPQNEDKIEEILDEAIPIQDQIEALRTKIQLNERYNRVLKDELEESRLGASSVLTDLYSETHELRIQLIEAINSEKAAVQNALRTQRGFQLAMTDKKPSFAIPWLEDKLFDLSKHLNFYLHRLIERQHALAAAEVMVMTIEKWPRPGSLPWEVEAIANFHHLESLTENMKVNLETANILHTNYHEVKYILREEKGKYAPILRNLDDQVRALKIEQDTLQKMLDDAIYFRDDAIKNLSLTEKEASENRKKRRRQMAKMKSAVHKVIESNQSRPQIAVRKEFLEAKREENASKAEFLENLLQKRAEVEKYQGRARRLVEIMRVPDLTFIPNRFRHVMALGERLAIEQSSKEELRDLLLRHKDQLYLIMCHFAYTGFKRHKDFLVRQEAITKIIKLIQNGKEEIRVHKNNYGDIILRLRLTAIALQDRLDEGRRRHQIKTNFQDTLKGLIARVRKLITVVKSLDQLFTRPPERNYSQYVKNPPLTSRLIRVGSPPESEESDEEEFIDMKIPTREEIKAKSQRVIHQGLLRKGLIH